MQRRNKTRNIGFVPGCTRFAAQGGSEETGDVTIGLDMIEAMRLVDAENLSQQEAAVSMGVSTPTLCRILGEARRRTITALLAGQNILIEKEETLCLQKNAEWKTVQTVDTEGMARRACAATVQDTAGAVARGTARDIIRI